MKGKREKERERGKRKIATGEIARERYEGKREKREKEREERKRLQ